MERRAQQYSARLADNEALAALTDMTSGVAHDINNIVGGILGRVELLKMQAKEPKVVAGLERVEELAMEGAETVRRIQEFTTSARYRRLEPVDSMQIGRAARFIARRRMATDGPGTPCRGGVARPSRARPLSTVPPRTFVPCWFS